MLVSSIPWESVAFRLPLACLLRLSEKRRGEGEGKKPSVCGYGMRKGERVWRKGEEEGKDENKNTKPSSTHLLLASDGPACLHVYCEKGEDACVV